MIDQMITIMINYTGSPQRAGSGAPKNGQERVVADRDGVNHLQYFMQGSWRHDNTNCKIRVNKECKAG